MLQPELPGQGVQGKGRRGPPGSHFKPLPEDSELPQDDSELTKMPRYVDVSVDVSVNVSVNLGLMRSNLPIIVLILRATSSHGKLSTKYGGFLERHC